ncbi:MAG: NAD(P)H-dependent glycerol-3-phosphate dehydrogenase [Cyanothece sp. SIO1E1]|nr:NAD(P)H-dependent glycerol-3-phosphate dehydrogenase [Cyanothece sp. SIO1E1]
MVSELISSQSSQDFSALQAQQKTVAILGAGAWGSALAQLAQANGHTVQIWTRRGSARLEQVLAGAQVVLSAISMKGVVETATQLQEIQLSDAVILATATKGLDPATTCTPSQIWQQAFPNHALVVLSGPNLSKEIDQGLPAATVAASQDEAAAEVIQTIFASDCFRVYTNPDPIGTELGGTLKNVIAIAVGVCDGLKLGTNAKSALITRALPEIIRIGTHLGANVETFYGLSGLGDLLATCSSPLSRNYQVGYGLAQGKSLEQILSTLQGTAEGVNTAHVLVDLANREGIPIPISRQVHRLLNHKITPEEAVAELMERDLKPEACLI